MDKFVVCIVKSKYGFYNGKEFLTKYCSGNIGPFDHHDPNYYEDKRYYSLRPIEWCKRTGVSNGLKNRSLVQIENANREEAIKELTQMKDNKFIKDWFIVEES